jgi:hypothetical protein
MMFIYYFVTLAAPFETVEQRLLGALTGLNDLADAAYREGEDIRSRMGPGFDPRLIAKTVRLESREPRRYGDDTTIPIVWEATGARLLFPRMEGDLILSVIEPGLTHLAFRGSYRPPMGALGRAIDRTMLHRVAEASVRSFVERIACAVTDNHVAAGAPTGAAKG